MVKAVIFDMDGTLLDSMYYWRNMDIFASRAFSFQMKEELDYRKIRGRFFDRVRDYVNLHGFDLDTETVKKELLKLGAQYYKKDAKVKDKVFEFLDFLKSKDIKMAVATATNGDLAREALKHFGILKYFEFVLSTEDIGIGKREPDIFLKSASMLGVNIENTIVFEDNPYAIRAAKEAGFRTGGVFDKNLMDEENEVTREIATWSSWDFSYYIDLFNENMVI